MADYNPEARSFPDTAVSTLEITIDIAESLQDLLIAELDELGCDVFMNEGETFKAYLPAPAWNEKKKAHLAQWLKDHHLPGSWEEIEIEAQDWNEPWERSIQPIVVPPFLVRPGWAPVAPGQAELIDIVVDPKMSFGTGHHESTRLVLRSLPPIIKPGCKVLDAGTGTAILAIAAAKLGAALVIAFDVDPWTEENAIENIQKNEVGGQVTFRVGSLDVVTEDEFDVVLANINRQVLLDYLPGFAEKVKHEGYLVLAGLLIEDGPMVSDAARRNGFELVDERGEGIWWSGIYTRLAV